MEALTAGNIETRIVTIIEQIDIINFEKKLISDGILLKKYISSGNKLILKIVLKKVLTFSIYIENIMPRIIPNKVADDPIITPTKKKILVIDLFNTPIDFNIAISRVLFLTSIVKPDIILNAATIIISDKIINITFLSTFKAENNELFISDHV